MGYSLADTVRIRFVSATGDIQLLQVGYEPVSYFESWCLLCAVVLQ